MGRLFLRFLSCSLRRSYGGECSGVFRLDYLDKMELSFCFSERVIFGVRVRVRVRVGIPYECQLVVQVRDPTILKKPFLVAKQTGGGGV